MPFDPASSADETLLIGYAGKGNFGDDIMIEAVAQACGLTAPDIVNGRTPLSRLLPRLLRARRIILCGGHVINPRTGSYLRILTLARLFGLRIVFFSIEVSGWPAGRKGRTQRWIMRHARVSVRTAASRAILNGRLPNLDVDEVIDAFYLHDAFSTSPAPNKTVQLGPRFSFMHTPTAKQEAERLVLLPRGFPDRGHYTDAQNVARFMEEVNALQEHTLRPIVLGPSANMDQTDALQDALEQAGHTVTLSGADRPLALTGADHVVTNRLHLAKACVFFDIPNTLISYDQKTEAPELFGDIGETVQLDGTRVAVARIRKDRATLERHRQAAFGVLGKGVAA